MAPPVAPARQRFIFDKPSPASTQPPPLEPGQRDTSFRRTAYALHSASTARPVASPSIETPTTKRRTQFASTPKFVFPLTNTTQNLPFEQTQHHRSLFQSLATDQVDNTGLAASFSDNIEEASQSIHGNNDELLRDCDSLNADELLFDEFDKEESVLEEPPPAETPRSPASKRVRLSSGSMVIASSTDQANAETLFKDRSAHRFLEPDIELIPEIDIQDHVLVSKRQAFMRSSSPVEGRSETDPLPAHFSPHRNGQKFEPGGLAATMRSQIMEMTSSSTHQSCRNFGQWKFEVIKTKAAAPITLVCGTIEDGKIGYFVLPGSRSPPVAGDTVQVQNITWHVDLAGHGWLVCIDWKIVK